MPLPLEGKIVLLTGAARRIGAATARRLHASGASLMLHYRSADRDAHALQEELNRIAIATRKTILFITHNVDEAAFLGDRCFIAPKLPIEDGIDANIEALADGIEIIDQMRCVRGIGKILAARLVSMIDISRADHVSSLWRYAGYGVDEEGKADRPKKGEKRKDNKRLKVACYVVAISFLKQKPPYTDIYYRAKEYYEASRSEWTKMHIHRAALRKMMKVFLQHLWLRWRLLEGLPISEPYVHNKMGHNHIYKPEEFGWPAL